MKLQTPPLLRDERQKAEYFEALNRRTDIGAVANLSQTISNPPTQAEVQAISNKVDQLLAAMRAAGIMEP